MSNFTTWRSLVDGEEIVAIPDSAVAHYDATQEGATGPISTINDLIGSADLSGDATVIGDGINGEKTYRFTDDELMRTTTNIADTDPQTVLAVIRPQNVTPNDDALMLDGDDINTFAARIEQDGTDYAVQRADIGEVGGSPSTDPQLFELEARNDDEINLRVDGAEIISATGNPSDLSGFTVAGRGDGGSGNSAEIDVGEIVILEDHSPDDQDGERSRLSDKWGISLD